MADLHTAYGHRSDFHFLVGVFGQVVTEYDPDLKLSVTELLEIFYDRVNSLGVEIVDEPWVLATSKSGTLS